MLISSSSTKLISRLSSSSRTIVRLCSSAKRITFDDKNRGGVPLSYSAFEAKTTKQESPLIIHHNLLGNKDNWTRFAREVNQLTRRKVVCVDARNHGSSPHSNNMSYALMAEDILLLMEKHEMEKMSFMGIGMGGRVGLLFALTQPQLLDKLIVINSTPLLSTPIDERWVVLRRACRVLKAIDSELKQVSGIQRRTLADKALATVLPDSFDRSLFLTNLTNGKPEVPSELWRLNLDAILNNVEISTFPIAGDTYHGRTLFITGENSNFLKKSDENCIRRMFPKAEFIWIPNSGYWIHAEKHKELLEALIPFLMS